MAVKLTKEDMQMLVSIAEHRALTVGLLSTLHERNAVALRRRILDLQGGGLVQLSARTLRSGPGRPENIISLTADGVGLLKKSSLLGHDVPCDAVTADAITCLDHQVLTNVFRVHLVSMTRHDKALGIRFFAPTSPFTPRPDSTRPMLQEKFLTRKQPVQDIEFTPDGVFVITHQEARKTLLFFLEVDMGTQTLVSSRPAKRDIKQKILNYRALFESEEYKRYEDVFRDSFRGFRLLCFTANPQRMSSLAELINDNQPTGFIWLTDRTSLATSGAGARIWVRGGASAEPRESILGSKAQQTESGPKKRP